MENNEMAARLEQLADQQVSPQKMDLSSIASAGQQDAQKKSELASFYTLSGALLDLQALTTDSTSMSTKDRYAEMFEQILEYAHSRFDAVKILVAQCIPNFVRFFPSLQAQALDAQLDLCEDGNVKIRMAAIKNLSLFAQPIPSLTAKISDILCQLLESDPPELYVVQDSLRYLLRLNPQGALLGTTYQMKSGGPFVIQSIVRVLLDSRIDANLIDRTKAAHPALLDALMSALTVQDLTLETVHSIVNLLQRVSKTSRNAKDASIIISRIFSHHLSIAVGDLLDMIELCMPFLKMGGCSDSILICVCNLYFPPQTFLHTFNPETRSNIYKYLIALFPYKGKDDAEMQAGRWLIESAIALVMSLTPPFDGNPHPLAWHDLEALLFILIAVQAPYLMCREQLKTIYISAQASLTSLGKNVVVNNVFVMVKELLKDIPMRRTKLPIRMSWMPASDSVAPSALAKEARPSSVPLPKSEAASGTSGKAPSVSSKNHVASGRKRKSDAGQHDFPLRPSSAADLVVGQPKAGGGPKAVSMVSGKKRHFLTNDKLQRRSTIDASSRASLVQTNGVNVGGRAKYIVRKFNP